MQFSEIILAIMSICESSWLETSSSCHEDWHSWSQIIALCYNMDEEATKLDKLYKEFLALKQRFASKEVTHQLISLIASLIASYSGFQPWSDRKWLLTLTFIENND